MHDRCLQISGQKRLSCTPGKVWTHYSSSCENSRYPCFIGYEASRSKQAPFPFRKDITVDTIASAGNKLWKELVGNQSKLNVTNVHLAFTGIEFAETGQQTIERFLKPPSPPQKRLYGGEILNTRNFEGVADEGPVENKTAYKCPRCGKTFNLPDGVETSSLEEQSGDILGYMNKVKLEHEDYHFAQDLANESEVPVQVGKATTSNNSNHKKRKKPQSKPGRIEKFFKS